MEIVGDHHTNKVGSIVNHNSYPRSNKMAPYQQHNLLTTPVGRVTPTPVEGMMISTFRERKRKVPPELSTTPNKFHRKDQRFESILDRSFTFWSEINSVLAVFIPECEEFQRGRIIHFLIHFLELKIAMDEFIPGHLLAPTAAIDQAWRSLVLETQLYKNVVKAISDFHGKPPRMIHYSIFIDNIEEKIRRTQSLFQVYYREEMPVTIKPALQLHQRPVTPTSTLARRQQTTAAMNTTEDDVADEDDTVSVSSSNSLFGLELI
jgi:hypothetical protein